LRRIFEHLFGVASGRRLVVVLDEFPYLCISHRALPSVLQRLWDERGRHSNICLVLCGSYVSFMEREVLAHNSSTPLLLIFSRSGFTPAVSRQEREGELVLVDVRLGVM